MNKHVLEAATLKEEEALIPKSNWFERSETLQMLRQNKKFPTIWCSGCGIGVVMGALIRAIDHLGLNNDQVALVAGIGCTARMPVYMDFNTLHTTHGRALAFATGLKIARPEMKVITIMGDGDAFAIGGNHFIHAARRNLGITALVVNNSIYGMTGGQYSPLTPHASFSTTCACGNIERQFDVCELAKATGATYVARGTTYHARQLQRLVVNAVQHKGFSVIDALCGCPTYYGKMNNQANAAAILEYQRDKAVKVEDAKTMTPEQLEDKFLIGELHHVDCDECSELYSKQFDKIYDKQRKV